MSKEFKAITVEYGSQPKSGDNSRSYTYLVPANADIKVDDVVIVPVKGRHTARATVATVSFITYKTVIGKVVNL